MIEWFVIHFVIITFGIIFTYHRLLTHRSFETYKFVEYLGTIVGCLSLTGGPISWSAVHMAHHVYSDTDKDPHSPTRLGWRMIFGKVNKDHIDKRVFVRIKHLINDPFHLFMEKYYLLVLFTGLVVLYLLFGWVGLLPSLTSAIASMASNYYLHTGKAINNRFVWLLMFGETSHVRHHSHPNEALTNKWYEPVNLYIKLLRTDN